MEAVIIIAVIVVPVVAYYIGKEFEYIGVYKQEVFLVDVPVWRGRYLNGHRAA